MTGKLELEYEGELVGSEVIAKELIRRAAGATFAERAGELDVERVVAWFDGGGVLRLSGEEPAEAGLKAFAAVDGLRDLVRAMEFPEASRPGVEFAACELVLEGLASLKRISRNEDDGSWGRARPERRRPRALDD
jgi:magnesium chelatase subunit I